MIEEIAIASVEQSQGVQEITKAMSELDKVTKQNSIIAHETSLNTNSLNKQAKGLNDISISLTDLITGQKNVDIDKIKKKSEKNVSSSESTQNKDNNSGNVIDFTAKKTAKSEAQASEHEASTPVSKKIVASDSISVPPAAEGEWEDI